MSPSGNVGKVVSLRVRPSQASELALDASGIVGEWNVTLGASVTAFDFATFYSTLGLTVVGLPAQLQFDSQGIHNAPAVAASNLLALRAESLKAVLDTAVAGRANAYYAKYGNLAAIIAQMQQSYSPTTTDSKPQLLADLSALAQQQASLLQTAYTADGRMGVVKTTTSGLTSTTSSYGSSMTDSDSSENAQSKTAGSVETDSTADEVGGPLVASPPPVISSPNFSATSSKATATSESTGIDLVYSDDAGTTTAEGNANEVQTITNTGYDYRVPSLEAAARNDRAQISLIDEQFSQFISGQSLPYLQQVFGNELTMIDLNVKRLQVAYLNTILLSPIDGVVTGVFTNLGDCVKAGDMIVRIENNQTVLLEGTLVYRGMVSVGDYLTVGTTLFSDPSQSMTITGNIVAARGHESEDDWWDVAVNCHNIDSSGKPIFPLHYSFDYDDTVVTISHIRRFDPVQPG